MTIGITSGGYTPQTAVSGVTTQSSGAGEVQPPPAEPKAEYSDKVTISREARLMSSGAGEVQPPPALP